MTSPVDDLKTILTQTKAVSKLLGPNSLTVLKDGREYEACYVVETHENIWKSTGKRSNADYYCLECFESMHGSDWIQISLKTKLLSKPVVRVHVITLHHLDNHPEKVAALMANEKFKQLFAPQ